jgi:hypothetical protein
VVEQGGGHSDQVSRSIGCLAVGILLRRPTDELKE